MFSNFIRTIRTPSSERFIVQAKEGKDAGVLELHYLQNGKVAGTVILFEQSQISDATLPELLKTIDEVLLPEVSIEHNQISFTVVRGRVVGNYEPSMGNIQ
jgi:hypothetical protein